VAAGASTTITVTVKAEDGTVSLPYTITVSRAAAGGGTGDAGLEITYQDLSSDADIDLTGVQDLSFTGTTGLNISAPAGYDHYEWYVDGGQVIAWTGNSISININNHPITLSKFLTGRHSVSLVVYNDGAGEDPASKNIFFQVTR
jgi:hypothetical protein